MLTPVISKATSLWQTPKKNIAPSGTRQKVYPQLKNRSSRLNVEKYAPNEEGESVSEQTPPTTLPLSSQKRRPQVVVAVAKEPKAAQYPPTVPGNSTYASMVQNGPKIYLY